MRKDISEKNGLFRTHKSYTPEEVLVAVGTTAFGRRSGKNNETLIKALQDAAPIEPFTDEEWNDLLKEMENDK